MSVRFHKIMSGKLLAALLGGALVVTGSFAAAAMPETVMHRLDAHDRTAAIASTQEERSDQTDDRSISSPDSAAGSIQAAEGETPQIPKEASQQAPSSQSPKSEPAETADSAVLPSEPAQQAQPEASAEAAEPMAQSEMQAVQSAPSESDAPSQASAPADDGIWHIRYIPTRGAVSAPADGEIGLWADGWFIAHSGLANGDRIATFPPRVEVDGKLYHLSDTWVSEDAITPEEVARIRANDGIAFQTCITDSTNWMAHYEPDGVGYGYQFTNYPYTVHDDASIGYYPQDYAGSTGSEASLPSAKQTPRADEENFQAFDE